MRMRRRRTRWSTQTARDEGLSLIGLVGGVLLAAALSGLCFLYVWQGNRIRTLTAATQEADRQLDAVNETNRILGVRIEEAFSVERIARIAREQLGMSAPELDKILHVPLPSDGSN